MKKIIVLFIFIASCNAEVIKIDGTEYGFSDDDSIKKRYKITNPYKTLVNKQSGTKAVITGNLMVKLNNVDPEIIANRYNLSVANNFKHLNIVFFNANNQNIFELKNTMEQDIDITNVSIDIIENKNIAY